MNSKKLWIVSALVAIFILWLIWTNINITTSHLEIKNEKIPAEFSTFKIAGISDLHNHPWGEKLIEKVKIEKPDIITITGDLVDSRNTDVDIAIKFIEEASKIAPIYYVTGNHESRLRDYNVLEERLISSGVIMMDNQSKFIEKANSKIQVLGIQDPAFASENHADNILSEKLKKDYFSIVLSHRPEQFEDYVSSGADLVLTGHAHGGQVRIPFIGGLVAPNQGLFPKYTEGIYSKGNTDMVVSRGLGHSIIPFRINNPPELLIISLV